MATRMKTSFLSSKVEYSEKLPHNLQYRKAILPLLYNATVSRPNIAMAVGNLGHAVEAPTERDWKAVKRVMRYLISTMDKNLRLSSTGKLELECLAANWAGDKAGSLLAVTSSVWEPAL